MTEQQQHINKKALVIFRVLVPYVSAKKLAAVGGALINSQITYAAPIWGQTTTLNINRVQPSRNRNSENY